MRTSQSAISTTKLHLSLLLHQHFHTSVLQLTLLISIVLLNKSLLVSAGLCREAQLCCNGRDSSCVVQKTPVNAIVEDLNDKPCYCDHACLKLGDCCVDFKDHCKVVDCQVSDWNSWSECDKSCGTGVTTRTRKVLQAPQNGGKHCPTLVQRRNCQGFRCHGERGKRLLHETALLLPSLLIQIHSSNKSKETFGFTHNTNKRDPNDYCIEFEVIKSGKECRRLPPYNLLIEGDRISVRCNTQKTYIKSNVLWNELKETSKDSSTMEELLSSKAKSFNSEFDLETDPTTLNSTYYYPIVDDEKKMAIVDRCRGEGVPGRTTRWRAVTMPTCHGKWLRLTLGTPKKCPHSQFVFV